MKKALARLRDLDPLSRAAFILFVFTFMYILFICVVFPLIFSPENLFREEYILSFRTPLHRHLNLLSILISLGVTFTTMIIIKKKETPNDPSKEKLNIVKQVLSAPEKEVISILEETKEITQDSLMFRLGWSRAKISTILTNMEKRNLLQRKREGKTYLVFLPRK